MRKFTKRFSALILAATMIASTAVSGYAASSPEKGNDDKGSTIITTEKTSKKNEVAVTNAKTSSDSLKNLFIKGKINKKYVKTISSGAVSDKKYDKITFELYKRTRVKKNVLKGKAKKTKTVVITKAKTAKKLVAKHFNKKAFKGYKGKIIVKKAAMKKKEFKKLKKKLKKGGFKGKIYYKK